MQRGSTVGLPLTLVLGLLLVVLGFGTPITDDTAATGQPGGRAVLMAQVAPDQTVARPAKPVQPPSGGFLAVLPVNGQVAEVMAQFRESDGSRGESRAADRSTRPVRAPPVLAA